MFVEGHYEVNNSHIQHGSKAVLSPFKSKTRRIPAPVDHHVPGPGAYSPHQTPAPVKRTILPWVNIICMILGSGFLFPSCFHLIFNKACSVNCVLRRGYYPAISAPPLIVPKDPPLPGPGQYDIGNNNSLSKRPVPTAAFASRTERIHQNTQAGAGPGPGNANRLIK